MKCRAGLRHVPMLRFVCAVFALSVCTKGQAYHDPNDKIESTPLKNRQRPVDPKVEELEELTAKSDYGMIRMNPRQVKDYILTKERSYSVMVFFTALNPANNCGMCQEIDPETKVLSEAYQLQKTGEEDHPLFFALVDYQDNEAIFRKMQLTQAPVIVLVPRSRSKLSLSKLLSQVGSKNTYSLMQGKTAENMRDFIDRAAKIHINFTRPWSTFEAVLALLVFIGAGVGVYLAWGFIDKLRDAMWIYGVLAMIVFFFCMSGGMFNHIRGTPWKGVNQATGRLSYISDQSRHQFSAEGYLMGSFNLVASIAIFLLINVSRNGYEKDEAGNPVNRWWANYTPLLMLVPIIMVCWSQIVSIYTMKNGHYRNGLVGMRG